MNVELIRNFTGVYNNFIARAARTENEDSNAAANMYIELSGILVAFIEEHGDKLQQQDVQFLVSETNAHCMHALVLRNMALSGFGDLSLSLGASRRLNDDLESARRRIEAGSGGGDENAADDMSDPRVHTNGLYEYTPVERLETQLNDLPGYEAQHRQLVQAYYIIDTILATDGGSSAAAAANLSEDGTIDGRTQKTRSGANAILYGPPGTGKTAAAKAVAASLRLDFVFVNAENLLSAYRSETEKNLRAIYSKMRLLVRTTGRNVVLLMDEIDGLVKNRANDQISSGDYSLLTKFLTILEPNDGSDNYGVFSVFTTNRLDNLDDAFRRRCSAVFFGPVILRDSRIRLFRKFFDDTVRLAPENEHELAASTVQWVPGDYARFKRDVAQPLQMQQYLDSKQTTLNDFYAAARSSSQANRRIVLELPLLNYESLRNAVAEYNPITPFERIKQDYGEQTLLNVQS